MRAQQVGAIVLVVPIFFTIVAKCVFSYPLTTTPLWLS